MIFLLVIAVPFIEIAVALQLIREFGFANAFFAWMASFVLGIGLIRTSSLRLTLGVAQSMRQGQPPGLAALDGALIGFAGVLFLLPGFISDLFAVLLLLPPLRRLCAKKLLGAVKIRTGQTFHGGDAGNYEDAAHAVIDVDAVVIEDKETTDR